MLFSAKIALFVASITFARESLSHEISRNSSLAKVYLGNFAILFLAKVSLAKVSTVKVVKEASTLQDLK